MSSCEFCVLCSPPCSAGPDLQGPSFTTWARRLLAEERWRSRQTTTCQCGGPWVPQLSHNPRVQPRTPPQLPMPTCSVHLSKLQAGLSKEQLKKYYIVAFHHVKGQQQAYLSLQSLGHLLGFFLGLHEWLEVRAAQAFCCSFGHALHQLLATVENVWMQIIRSAFVPAQPTLSQPDLDDVNLDKNNDSVSFIMLDQFFSPSVHFLQSSWYKVLLQATTTKPMPAYQKRFNQHTLRT